MLPQIEVLSKKNNNNNYQSRCHQLCYLSVCLFYVYDNTPWYSFKEQDVLCGSESEEKLLAATAKWPPSRQRFSPVVV